MRIAAGRDALSSPTGKKYELALFPAVQKSLNACVPVGSISPENLGKFTVVAEVSQSGVATLVDAGPHTRVSSCFAKHFRTARLPAPPPPPAGRGNFPIAIEINVTP
jgi:hypothetical protein